MNNLFADVFEPIVSGINGCDELAADACVGCASECLYSCTEHCQDSCMLEVSDGACQGCDIGCTTFCGYLVVAAK